MKHRKKTLKAGVETSSDGVINTHRFDLKYSW
jgi:hypothetical protein